MYRYSEIVTAMYDIGFSKEQQDSIFAILASILHFGTMEFRASGDADPAKVDESASDAMQTIVKLLQLDTTEFRESLQTATNITRGETIKRHFSYSEAVDARDAVAKTLYGRLFGWLVSQINVLLATSANKHVANSIGILDIFGFENFQHNSFEQWCINLANEQLQQFFNQHVFELELQEYAPSLPPSLPLPPPFLPFSPACHVLAYQG